MKKPPFEWDDEKAAANLKKYGVDFDEAASVLRNPLAAEFHDAAHSVSEERWITIGHSKFGTILVVCFTEIGGMFRIISARKANKHEITIYEERRPDGI